MTTLAIALILAPIALALYAYVLYPAILRLLAARRPAEYWRADPAEWPMITLTVPAYNEARSIAATLDGLLAVDYPPERRHILVISDASTDGMDDIVRGYADRGVELLRLPERGGKSAAENAAAPYLRGDIVVNVDATIRLRRDSLKALVRAFSDPAVGVASGRDVSVASVTAPAVAGSAATGGEATYAGYEMWVRGLETRVDSIVGASGCFYGIRREIYDGSFPNALSRDFASALMAKEHGFRAVSAFDAVCLVPRSTALSAELRRKTRTMARGLQTLWFKRHLLNPLHHGAFAFCLASHKLARWLVYLAAPVAPVGLAILAVTSPLARVALAAVAVGLLAGAVAIRWPRSWRMPGIFALPGFAVTVTVAGLLAWIEALRGHRVAHWEPTRRPT